jgi:hypothetical protein
LQSFRLFMASWPSMARCFFCNIHPLAAYTSWPHLRLPHQNNF